MGTMFTILSSTSTQLSLPTARLRRVNYQNNTIGCRNATFSTRIITITFTTVTSLFSIPLARRKPCVLAPMHTARVIVSRNNRRRHPPVGWMEGKLALKEGFSLSISYLMTVSPNRCGEDLVLLDRQCLIFHRQMCCSLQLKSM